MNGKNFNTPMEIAEHTVGVGVKKVNKSWIKQLFVGLVAGAFIAFAAEGSNMAAFNLFGNPDAYGLGKALAGAIFATGLMMVVIAGGDLFTGNNLIILSVLEKKTTISQMLRNWFFVYIGNFIGSVLIAYMIVESGQLHSGANGLAAVTMKIASYKVSLSFMQAFYLGVMCNWIVCLAVWMAYGAKDVAGKILAMFFPIWLFVTSGFEHSVANMYYVPVGILAKANAEYVEASHLSAEKLANLNWGSFITNNLIPVTLGNIVGGVVFVGGIYWFLYLKKDK
ncbi:formate/nitrite transporter family protein [Anaeromicrobium sediminis]|uniref:FdhC protein n=1 Tax=Anaeromicrobium sediminis TaxID=1478221 RepID=A0A267MLQ4_9FIRM|nr:formate/nitrite transporter family protein [Anaeromicrobium sediminis]PAB60519.1 FdhC protein [Anaeromicrobium sediminis]